MAIISAFKLRTSFLSDELSLFNLLFSQDPLQDLTHSAGRELFNKFQFPDLLVGRHLLVDKIHQKGFIDLMTGLLHNKSLGQLSHLRDGYADDRATGHCWII